MAETEPPLTVDDYLVACDLMRRIIDSGQIDEDPDAAERMRGFLRQMEAALRRPVVHG